MAFTQWHETLSQGKRIMLAQSDYHIHASFYRIRQEGEELGPTVAEQQRSARAQGCRFVGIVEHCNKDPRHPFHCLEELSAEYHSASFDRTDTWLGVEADLHDDGSDDCGAEGRAKLGLHYVIGSVHLDENHPATVEGYVDMEFRRIRNALLHNPNIDIIGHPFGSMNFYERTGVIPKWDFGLVPREYLQEIVHLAVERRVALEMNRCLMEDPAYIRFWEDIRDAGALFEIGSDAHKTGATYVIQTRTEFAQHLGLQEDRHWKPTMRDNCGGCP